MQSKALHHIFISQLIDQVVKLQKTYKLPCDGWERWLWLWKRVSVPAKITLLAQCPDRQNESVGEKEGDKTCWKLYGAFTTYCAPLESRLKSKLHTEWIENSHKYSGLRLRQTFLGRLEKAFWHSQKIPALVWSSSCLSGPQHNYNWQINLNISVSAICKFIWTIFISNPRQLFNLLI